MRVTFSNVQRSRPIVLTDHEVSALSKVVGRDVLPELAGMCAERYEVMTMGHLMRTLTVLLSSERQHIGGRDCWCGPTAEYVDPDTGAAVYVHKGRQ